LAQRAFEGKKMQDLKARYEKVCVDIAECEMIGSLAADADKRKMFRELAEQYKRMADALKKEIDRRSHEAAA
jgi:hypothetical protein